MENILSTVEAAQYAGVSRNAVLKWIHLGYLPVVNKNAYRGPGCGYKIHESDLDDFLSNRRKRVNKPIRKLVKPKVITVDKEPMRIAAANLRIAIEFAQEELSKIEKLL